MFSLVLLCRPNFEKECASEIAHMAGEGGLSGFPRTQAGSGFVQFCLTEEHSAMELAKTLDFTQLIFTRQGFVSFSELTELPEKDKLSKVMEGIKDFLNQNPGMAVPQQVLVENPDTSHVDGLKGFSTSFSNPLSRAISELRKGKKSDAINRFHIFFVSYENAFLGVSRTGASSHWPGGIVRLKFPKNAPSRSTLKLDEAFSVLLTPEENKNLLAPSMKAVDLGASPGGWSFQFVQKHILVQAIDNGPMDKSLMDSGLVEHLRADGFTYKPHKPVDWMVCDMVEQPSRIANLVALWLREEYCRHVIVNLKLPMKKRFDEVQICLGIIANQNKHHSKLVMRCKQLYHDRDEVTLFASIGPKS
jgi:23S rRNA (cytidine2498-2'-O)-methyltransferase